MSVRIELPVFGRIPIWTAVIDAKPDTSEAEKLGQAVQWAMANGKPLVGAQLRMANLSGLDLSNQDLSGADLTGASMNGVNLRMAKLSGAILKTARICNSRLDHANFDGADLQGADLIDTNCEATLFCNANLLSTNFQGADVLRASFTNAKLGRDMLTYTQWQSASLDPIKLNALQHFSREPLFLDRWAELIQYGRSGAVDIHQAADPGSLWEAFLHSVWIGDKPEDQPTARIALEWIQAAIKIRDAVRS